MLGRRMPWEESSMFSSFISPVFAGFAPGVSGEEDGDGVGSGRGAATTLLLLAPMPRPLM
jgi:hypothetical protein